MGKKTESSRKEKKSGRKEGGREVSEPQIEPEVAHVDSTKEGENVQSKMEGEEKLMEMDANNEKTEDISVSEQHKNPEYSLPSESNEVSSNKEQTEDQLPKEPAEVSAASDAAPQASVDPPDVSDMLRFSLSYPGGACVASLSLMTLGLLNIHVSIPKQIVVVDSSLVDNDVAKK